MADIDSVQKKKCTHQNSGKRADLLVRSTDIEITDRSKGSRTQFVLDIKVVTMVNGKGSWQEPRTSIRRNLKTLVYCKLRLKSIASLRLSMLVLDTSFLVRVLVLLARLLSDICGLLSGWNSASMP